MVNTSSDRPASRELPADLLRCPRCGASLTQLVCSACAFQAERDGGIVDFVASAERDDSFRAVNQFYEANPFPGYAPGDDAGTLLDRSRRSPFLASLDAAIPAAATILDCGCGTGQLSSFLALSGPRRTVLAADACRASLRLTDGFRQRAGITNLHLLRVDLFALPFAEQAFEIVISRGVVHHTADPWRAIDCVARRVAPGGFLVLGFYESAARTFHRLRQRIYRLGKGLVPALDPILRRGDLSDEKKRIWIADQYEHPLEHCLSFARVWRQLHEAGFAWIRSVPPAPGEDPLLRATDEPGSLQLATRRIGWSLAGLRDEDAGMACLVVQRLDRSARVVTEAFQLRS